MDEKEMKDLFTDGMQSIRMNYYPPCPEPDKTIGLSPHSDSDTLTILLQLNDTEGLQVRKDGIWVPIKPLPNALIVNVGDMMEIVSNGVYRSIEHRAVVNSNKERLSLATFNIFNLDSELGPAHSLIGPHNPAKFRSIRVENFLQEFFARKLDGKLFIDCMKLETKDDESQIVNDGVYRSIEHRAVVNSDEERLSVATFYFYSWMKGGGSKLDPGLYRIKIRSQIIEPMTPEPTPTPNKIEENLSGQITEGRNIRNRSVITAEISARIRERPIS
ncbi:PREDICTED: codeine O-demethylase-like [Nicotiana attenuata]|uniref:codeine O-demethylase-like n=1 Tax=Nicotiana attenuata TaxID=49451 RepID=UPI0009045F0E|nr:PREDICTED: codeine O-demethylase-like [Nicotiana attenuata]